MKEDGLIGNFVGKPNTGKSTYLSMLETIFKCVTVSPDALYANDYAAQDLYANIVTHGRDFAFLNETEGLNGQAVAKLKPLVTYTDKVSARFFKGNTFAAEYHGSVVLVSNHLNSFKLTGDLKKRIISVSLKHSKLVAENIEWMRSEEGCAAFLLACLLERGKMMREGYKTAEKLKAEVVFGAASGTEIPEDERAVLEEIAEYGCIKIKDAKELLGKKFNDVVSKHKLVMKRKYDARYLVPESDAVLLEIKRVFGIGTVNELTMTVVDLYEQESQFFKFDRMPYRNAFFIDKSLYSHPDLKNSDKAVHFTASGETRLSNALTFDKMVLDYDELPKGMVFHEIVNHLSAKLGNVWWAVWETQTSTFDFPRIRLCLLLGRELNAGFYKPLAERVSATLGFKHDPACSPVHKQMLAMPWKQFYFNEVPYYINTSMYVNGEQAVEDGQPTKNTDWVKINRHTMINMVTKEEKPLGSGGISYWESQNQYEAYLYSMRPVDAAEFDEIKLSIAMERDNPNNDDYYWWMRRYLIPLSCYIKHDKSITMEQGIQLIRLTAHNEQEELSNIRQLVIACNRNAGDIMADDVDHKKIYNFYVGKGRSTP